MRAWDTKPAVTPGPGSPRRCRVALVTGAAGRWLWCPQTAKAPQEDGGTGPAPHVPPTPLATHVCPSGSRAGRAATSRGAARPCVGASAPFRAGPRAPSVHASRVAQATASLRHPRALAPSSGALCLVTVAGLALRPVRSPLLRMPQETGDRPQGRLCPREAPAEDRGRVSPTRRTWSGGNEAG